MAQYHAKEMWKVRVRRRWVLVLVLAEIAGSSRVWAQRTHEGFWIGWVPAGIGIGPDAKLGPALALRLGGTISQQVLLGVELISWYDVSADSLVGLAGNLAGTVLFYPSPGRGAFAKGGIGVAISGIEPSPGGAGVGTTLGLGFDIQVGKNFFLTPAVDWLFQTIDDTDEGWQVNNLLLFTIALTGH